MNAKQSEKASAAQAEPRTQKPLIRRLSDEVAAEKMTFDEACDIAFEAGFDNVETLMLDQVALARIALKQGGSR